MWYDKWELRMRMMKKEKKAHTHPHTYTQWTNENYDKLENKRVFFLYEFAHDTDISTEQISGLAHSALAMYYICYWEDPNRQKKNIVFRHTAMIKITILKCSPGNERMKMHAFVSREMDSTVMLTEWKRYDFNMQIKKRIDETTKEKSGKFPFFWLTKIDSGF